MEAVAVAVIAAVGVVLAALVQAGRKENKSDHGIVADLLKGLHVYHMLIQKRRVRLAL